MPTISVVIPTCDRPTSLRLCLSKLSQLLQGIEDFEIVVTDDGVNSSQKIVADYPSARWVAGPRHGPAANRNHGARVARSSIIAFTDDDCIPDRNWLKCFVDAAHSYPEVAVFEGRTYAGDERVSAAQESPVNSTGGHFWSCNLAVRRDAFFKINGFDEDFPYAAFEDMDFATRFRAAGMNSMYIPTAAVCHPWRLHGGWKTWKKRQYSLRLFSAKHPSTIFRQRRFWATSLLRNIAKLPLEFLQYRGRGALFLAQRSVFQFQMLCLAMINHVPIHK